MEKAPLNAISAFVATAIVSIFVIALARVYLLDSPGFGADFRFGYTPSP